MLFLITKVCLTLAGLIYCFSKKDCEQVTKELLSRKVKCGAYHADVSLMERKYLLNNWKSENLQVSVFTIIVQLYKEIIFFTDNM